MAGILPVALLAVIMTATIPVTYEANVHAKWRVRR